MDEWIRRDKTRDAEAIDWAASHGMRGKVQIQIRLYQMPACLSEEGKPAACIAETRERREEGEALRATVRRRDRCQPGMGGGSDG
jgi:hypothetical protein